ncbi:unnamed protein product [Hymenolepis diminuta]|uniref:Fibronectin type-III domain-containing protein n=1 Tax=Hymenolepis diminuta TaxID=6216 RepID=A0A158QC00_HYMDI|nr:unnamed protein product [Hymenolepis diminuta]
MGAYHLFCLFLAFPLVASQASPDFDLKWDIRCSRESKQEIILSWYPPQLSESEVFQYNVSCNLDDYYWLNFTTTGFTHKIPVIAGEKFVASVTPIIESKDGVRYGGVPATTKLTESTATDQSVPSNVTLVQVSSTEAILSWNPPINKGGEILGYKVLYTSGQTPSKMDVGNFTRVSMRFGNEASAIEASVATTTEKNVESQKWHFSKIVRIELPTTGSAPI